MLHLPKDFALTRTPVHGIMLLESLPDFKSRMAICSPNMAAAHCWALPKG